MQDNMTVWEPLNLLAHPVWVFAADPHPVFTNAAAASQSPGKLWRQEGSGVPRSAAEILLDCADALGKSYWSVENAAQKAVVGRNPSRPGQLVLVATQVGSQASDQLQQTQALQRKLQAVVAECDELRARSNRLMQVVVQVHAQATARCALTASLQLTLQQSMASLRAACSSSSSDDIARLEDVSAFTDDLVPTASSACRPNYDIQVPPCNEDVLPVFSPSQRMQPLRSCSFTPKQDTFPEGGVARVNSSFTMGGRASPTPATHNPQQSDHGASAIKQGLSGRQSERMGLALGSRLSTSQMGLATNLDQVTDTTAEEQRMPTSAGQHRGAALSQGQVAKAMYEQALEASSAMEVELNLKASNLIQMQSTNVDLQIALDKVQQDAAKQKASFDLQLNIVQRQVQDVQSVYEKTLQESLSLKRNLQLQEDYVCELHNANTGMKAAMDQATHDATEMKAAFDKGVEDAVEQKATFDSQLLKANADATEMKAAFDKGVEDAVEQKAAFDSQLLKANADATEMKAAFDKGVEDAVEQKATFDSQLLKANADATEMKAAFDKGVVDAVEQKATFDSQLLKASADATEMKAAFDKGVVDAVEQKAVFDSHLLKANADATEMKAAFDKGVEDAVEQKATFDSQLLKANADATEIKAAFDKGVVDAVEQKATFDSQLLKASADATEMKAAFDKGVEDAVEQKATFDSQLLKANADATEMKAAFDKGVVDAVEQKATFDSQLLKANADATEMKAAYGKGVVDAVEQKATFDSQLHKANADATEMKAAYDKGVVDAVEQKATFDSQLLKASAHATEMKAAFDKGVEDAVEQKATFDSQLLKANADATEMKAAYDKGVVDAAEHKATFDSQLLKANADATEMKAAFDKGVEDAVEQKATFDSQLLKANADATEMKAAFDKGVEDAVEQKATFDSQLLKANADATEMKAAFDKGVEDAVEQKATFDSQLLKANADATEMKAAFDKGVVDAVEHKATFDSQLLKANADATEMKAAFNKGVVDAVEQKAAFDSRLLKATADAVEMKAAYDQTMTTLAEQAELLQKTQDDAGALKIKFDVHVTELTVQATQAQLEANLVREALAKEQERLAGLQDEHTKLLHQREVLQAELQVALHTYTPTAIIDQGTPADKMLTMLTELLDGTVPSINDIMFVQSAILESLDIYTPCNIGKQLLQGAGIDTDVGLSLLSQLGGGRGPEPVGERTLEDFCTDRRRHASSEDDDHGVHSMSDENERFESLEEAMNIMLSINFNYNDADQGSRQLKTASVASSSSAYGVATLLHRKSMRVDTESKFKLSASGSLSRAGRGGSAGVHATLLDSDYYMANASGTASDGINQDEEDDVFPTFSLLAPPPFEEVNRVLASSNMWQFDAFKLADVTNGHPLSALGFFAFHQAGLIDHFGLRADRLARFLRRVEDGYLQNPNPYHNSTHAADVVQSMSLILRKGGLVPGYADPLTHLACLLAAIVHDYEHVGRTNDFLVTSGHELAMLYNDKAPLENHHVSSALSLLRKPEYDFLSTLSKAEMDKLRKTIIELVLGTDMKQHFAILSHFTTVHRLGTNTSASSSLASTAGQRMANRMGSESGTAASISSVGSAGNNGDDVQIVIPLDETERMITLQMALKCSDLGHTGAALPVHLKWVAGLEEEFFRQGDAEQLAGIPMSALFDRTKQGISKSQIGFYDVVVIPLFHAFSRVFTSTKPLMAYVMRNYKVWCEQQKSMSEAIRPRIEGPRMEAPRIPLPPGMPRRSSASGSQLHAKRESRHSQSQGKLSQA